jgi:phage-related tail protein
MGLGAASTAPSVTARPLTQQGLAGAKTSSNVGRQVQDAQYFYTKLSEKMAQVTAANEGLRQELLAVEKSRSRQTQMQTRLDELKDEVSTAEVQLRDYNLILQRAGVQATAADVEESLTAVNVRIQHSAARPLPVRPHKLRIAVHSNVV